MTDNDDLVAVRDLRAQHSDPSDVAVARVRLQVQHGLDGTSPTERVRGRWLAVAASGVAAAGVLVAAISFLSPDPGPAPLIAGQQPTVTASAAAYPQPVGAQTPLVLQPGELLFSRCGGETSNEELWIDVEGAFLLRSRTTDNGRVVYDSAQEQEGDGQGPKTRPAGEAEAALAALRATLAADGPSLAMPTPAYLNSLPTEPAALLAIMTAAWDDTQNTKHPQGYNVFKEAAFLLPRIEPVLSPDARAAFLAALGMLPGVTVGETTFAGRPARTVTSMPDNTVVTIYTDTVTGRILGTSLAFQQQAPVLSPCTYLIVNSLDDVA